MIIQNVKLSNYNHLKAILTYVLVFIFLLHKSALGDSLGLF